MEALEAKLRAAQERHGGEPADSSARRIWAERALADWQAGLDGPVDNPDIGM